MNDFDNLVIAKNNLMAAMGDKFPIYMKLMKKWFKMEISKEDFDYQARRLLRRDQQHLHNKVLIQLLSVCRGLAERPPSPNSCRLFLERSERHKRQRTSGGSSLKRSYSTAFQTANLHDYAPANKVPAICKVEVPETLNYIEQERSTIDENMLFGRLTTSAWENGLDGATLEAAQLLSVAAKNFVKNILVATLNQRKGYKVREGSFIYAAGSSVTNPWSRPRPRDYTPRYSNDPYFYGLVSRSTSSIALNRFHDEIRSTLINIKRVNNNSQVQTSNAGSFYDSEAESLNRERIRQNLISDSIRVNYNPNRTYRRHKITLQDLFNAVRINRSMLLSQSVYLGAFEKLIGKSYHLTWDDMEGQ